MQYARIPQFKNKRKLFFGTLVIEHLLKTHNIDEYLKYLVFIEKLLKYYTIN